MAQPPTGAGRLRVARIALTLAAVGAVAPGAWAVVSPRSFYDSFPGAMHWVSRLPPYNEHLVLDVGSFYLAFALLFAWSALRPRPGLVLPVCAAWTLCGALHLLFHATHLERFSAAEATAQIASLALAVALPLIAAWALIRAPGTSTTVSEA